MQELGYNYRLTDFQAAWGISQLERAKAGLERRHEIVKRYNEAFAEIDGIKTPFNAAAVSYTHLVLFAGYKGDINAFVEGAAAIHSRTPQSRVLIAEACTHAPLTEDIGTVKIPRLL